MENIECLHPGLKGFLESKKWEKARDSASTRRSPSKNSHRPARNTNVQQRCQNDWCVSCKCIIDKTILSSD